MEPDNKNMTINEYTEDEATKERKLWDNVRSKISLTNYDEADCDSFHQNKSNTFNYPYSHNLPPPHPCSLPVQPYPKNHLVSTNVSDDVDIKTSTTKSNLDELLEEFGDEILNVTMVDEEADFNPTKDIEDLERLLAKDPQLYLMRRSPKVLRIFTWTILG
uniref:Phytochrome B n=1 Tax=Tanacetum cinerariifolium TaxID=118510 RepID=A0A699H0U3_TANCI|nr:phytochrome B [Tanacetum cinerariifolium]